MTVKRTPVSRKALWVWGRLRDFEERLVSKSPEHVMETLTEQMKEDVRTRAPKLAAWLDKIGGEP